MNGKNMLIGLNYIDPNRCIAKHDTPANCLVFQSMKRWAMQVVLHLTGQHQTGVFHGCVVKQPIEVCHQSVCDIIEVFHFLTVNRENGAIGKGDFYRIAIHVVETMQRLYHIVILS